MWRVIEGEPRKLGGVYKWETPVVEPCQEQRVRIWVQEVKVYKDLGYEFKTKFL